MGTAAAIVGGSVLGGVIQSQGAKSAASKQAGAADRGTAEQRAARLAAEERLQPFVDIGLGAGESLQNILADPFAGLEEINPIVDFLRTEGFEQIQESAAARGRLGAGGTLKDLTQFNTDIASTVAPQLQNQRFNQLFNVLGLGQNAAAGQGTAALSTSSNISNLLGNKGAAQAAGKIGQTNAITGGIQNVLGAAGAFPNMFGGGGGQTFGAGKPVGQQVFGLGNEAGGGGTGALSTFGL